MENQIATAEDFNRASAEEQQAEAVLLPKLGKAVLMKRPSPLWFIFRGQLPQSLAASASGAAPPPPIHTAEDAERVARWITDLLKAVMVSPRVSLTPREGEIAPDQISEEDLNFIIRWAVGEVASAEPDGSCARDLAPFRGES